MKAEVVERWQPFTMAKDGDAGDGRARGGGYRRDLFKFIDVIALGPGFIMAVQSTSKQQLAAHVRKIVHTPEIRENALAWLQAGGWLVLMGWHKVGNRWHADERKLTAMDLVEARAAHDPGFDRPKRRAGTQTEITF